MLSAIMALASRFSKSNHIDWGLKSVRKYVIDDNPRSDRKTNEKNSDITFNVGCSAEFLSDGVRTIHDTNVSRLERGL